METGCRDMMILRYMTDQRLDTDKAPASKLRQRLQRVKTRHDMSYETYLNEIKSTAPIAASNLELEVMSDAVYGTLKDMAHLLATDKSLKSAKSINKDTSSRPEGPPPGTAI